MRGQTLAGALASAKSTSRLARRLRQKLRSDRSAGSSLSRARNAVIDIARGIGTIENNSVGPVVSLSVPDVTEGTGGVSSANVTVRLQGRTTVPITVIVRTVSGTAIDGEDFIGGARQIVFPVSGANQDFQQQVVSFAIVTFLNSLSLVSTLS